MGSVRKDSPYHLAHGTTADPRLKRCAGGRHALRLNVCDAGILSSMGMGTPFIQVETCQLKVHDKKFLPLMSTPSALQISLAISSSPQALE
mmetsp:Transcript_44323/g.107772  ORF Transcript_44323/g.107772 Transcript_44323/m.107772 type:complete len:91 (-) Transcript_44323:561-833(-)